MKRFLPYISSLILAGFGLLTLFLSSSVIFDWFGIRAKEGNYVLFVVWANFFSSLLYLISVYGFLKIKSWTFKTLLVATVILIVALIGLFVHIYSGGIYETKTVFAMIFRISVTIAFTAIAYFQSIKRNKKIYFIMLVKTRKLIFSLIVLSGWNIAQAQEVWTLKQCINTAQVHNKTLKINRNNISISEQRKKEAQANLIPKVTANTDYKYFMELPTQLMPMNALNPQAPEGQFRDLQFGVPHNINVNVQLAVPLYNPQIYGAIQSTQIAKELTELQFQKSEEQVLFDITTLYYNAQIIVHQLAFLDSNMVNTEKLLKNMQLLKDQLLAKGSDVSKVKLQAEQLHTQRQNVNNKLIQVLNALKLNMGISLEQNISVVSEIQQEVSLESDTRNVLELKIIQKQNQLLHSDLKTLNQSRLLPSLNLIASYGTTGFGYDKKPNDFMKFYPIGFAGIQLGYPLFNGTVTQRKINQKKLEITNNELQSKLITEKIDMEVENAIRQKTIAQSTITNTESQIALAKTIYEQTVLQQKQGTASLTDVLLADNALREAQQNYLNAVIDFLKADLELKKLTGSIKN